MESDWGGLPADDPGQWAPCVTAAVLTQLPLRRHVGRRLFVAVGIFGVAAIVFGLSQDYWLSACAVFVLGAADMVSVYVRGTLVPSGDARCAARARCRRGSGLHRRLQ